MYQSLAFHDDSTSSNHAPIFSVDNLKDNKIETFRGHKTSKRTLLVCSLVLIATSGILATWMFVQRPKFYPKLGIFGRSSKEIENYKINKLNIKTRTVRNRREIVINKIRPKSKFTVDVINSQKLFPFNDSRLPFDLIPEEYFLHLDVDLNLDTYSGTTKIILSCDRKTNKIVFHGRQIVLSNATIILEQEVVQYRSISYLKKFELFVIQFDGNLVEGKKYELRLEYNATYGKTLAGFYKSNYTNAGSPSVMVSTHFEPTDARSAFPCLDEPFFKAKFHVSVTHKKALIAISNMPLKKSTNLSDDNVLDEFDVSVRMSTYLVAFTVNDFKYQERFTPSGLPVRVYARKDDYNRIGYAVEAGTKIIAFYEQFFNVTYPLPKLDLLSVPDFMAGAMEDWGLVSFRSAYLIFDPMIMTVESQRQITLVIAHELAHQWFGNLVTMKWWNDIWLNEGFANFVEMYGTNEVNAQFQALDMQVPTGWQAAISLDSLKNSHPVSQNVHRNSEIDELFDAISYNKGASLLRMVQGFMKDKFIKGVKTYLEEYKFANAETNDLWKHLSEATSNTIDVKEIMDTWTQQRSFPVITLNRSTTNEKFTASQESFLVMADSNQSLKQDNKSLWNIPFSYITDENLTPVTVFMKEREKELEIDNTALWVKANYNCMGFYVVNYDNQTWTALSRQLMNNHMIFSDVDRACLLHDAFKLACENLIDPTIPLEMTRYLQKERAFIPWAMIRARSECMSMMLPNKNDKIKYKKYIWKMQSHLVNINMLECGEKAIKRNLTIFERLQRFEAFSFALKHHFRKDYKKKIEECFKDMVHEKDMKGMTSENRALALMYGYNATNEMHWNHLWQIYSMSEVDADRKIVMRAFAQFRDHDKINLILQKSLDTSTMRLQDTIPMLSNIVKMGSRKLVWDFVVKHYERFKERYGGGYQLGQLMSEVAGGFNTHDMLKEVKAFLKIHPIGAKGSRTELQVLEKINNNIHRHSDGESNRRTIKKIKDWLEEEPAKRDSL